MDFDSYTLASGFWFKPLCWVHGHEIENKNVVHPKNSGKNGYAIKKRRCARCLKDFGEHLVREESNDV